MRCLVYLTLESALALALHWMTNYSLPFGRVLPDCCPPCTSLVFRTMLTLWLLSPQSVVPGSLTSHSLQNAVASDTAMDDLLGYPMITVKSPDSGRTVRSPLYYIGCVVGSGANAETIIRGCYHPQEEVVIMASRGKSPSSRTSWRDIRKYDFSLWT